MHSCLRTFTNVHKVELHVFQHNNIYHYDLMRTGVHSGHSLTNLDEYEQKQNVREWTLEWNKSES